MTAPVLRIDGVGGLLSVQDLGRPGWQHYGVTPGGALDAVALQIANALCGNGPGAAALEMVLGPAPLAVLQDVTAALAGADFSAAIDGVAWPNWSSHRLRAGQRITFGSRAYGTVAYLAVAGGLDGPEVLGSRSSMPRYIAAPMIPPLRPGDELAPARRCRQDLPGRQLAPDAWPPYARAQTKSAVARVVLGPHTSAFTRSGVDTLLGDIFRVLTFSDRMGYRLDGPEIELRGPADIPSEASTLGAIQVAAGGSPTVLMADRPTTGGYAKIAVVARVDVATVAQRAPGEALCFAPTTVEEAQALLRAQERFLRALSI